MLNGSAGVSADMDLRLSEALGTTPGLWFNMQADYDLWQAPSLQSKGAADRFVCRSLKMEPEFYKPVQIDVAKCHPWPRTDAAR